MKASEAALASLCPRYFKPSLCIHACRSAASSGSSLMTQSASPARSRRALHSHRLLMATLGQWPSESKSALALRRSRVQKWPARSCPSHSSHWRTPAPVPGLDALRLVAQVDSPRVLVEEGVPIPGREGHGLLLHRLVAVHQLPPAVDEEHGSPSPHAELPDLLGAHAAVLPAPIANRIEIRQHLCQGKLQQLRQLTWDAQLVPPPLKGRLQDLVALPQLVGDLAAKRPERLPQAGLHHDPVVDHLGGLGAQSPLPAVVEEVLLARKLQQRGEVVVRAQLGQHRLLDVAGHLRLGQAGLPLEPHVQGGDGQIVLPLVGPPVLAAPPNAHRHVGQPLRVLVPEEGLAQSGANVRTSFLTPLRSRT